jgi:hypothetical protein
MTQSLSHRKKFIGSLHNVTFDVLKSLAWEKVFNVEICSEFWWQYNFVCCYICGTTQQYVTINNLDTSLFLARLTLGKSRSQWPRGLRSSSSAARLLRSWVRIPLGALMFVCCECCVLSGRGLCDGLITHPDESYRLWCVAVCDLEKPRERGGHGPRWTAAPHEKKSWEEA